MFAHITRIKTTLRVLLIAVILFNALMPGTFVAQAKQESATANSNPQITKQDDDTFPVFERPKPRLRDRNSDDPHLTLVTFLQGAGQQITTNEVLCSEYGNGIRCDFNFGVWSNANATNLGRVNGYVEWADSRGSIGTQAYYGMAVVDAPSSTYWEDPNIDWFGNVFSTGDLPATGLGHVSRLITFNANHHYAYFGFGAHGGDASMSGYFIISPTPIGCDYIAQTSDTYELDPTLELPLGPAGMPSDNQIYPTIPGEVYKISTGGGPWNDGTTDRGKETAISWDGETWTHFDKIPWVCKNQSDGSIYVKAESNAFHIRVDDTEGNFADNSNKPDAVTYTIARVIKPDVDWRSIRNSGVSKTSTIQAVVELDSTFSNIACTVKCEGDPINTHTGVFSFTLPDLSFPTSAGNLVFQRSYSTGALDTAGVLGYGWTHNHDAKLIFPTDAGGMEGYVLFQSVLGNQFLFIDETNGSYTPGPGVIASLTKSTTTPITYTLTDSQQAVFKFNENGRLILRKDAQGHEFNYDYDMQGKLTKVSTDNGARFIQIGYDAQNRINSVSNHASQQVTFLYNASGDLVSATDVLGQTWTYVYDVNHHMTQMKDPAGKATVTTDTMNRAARTANWMVRAM